MNLAAFLARRLLGGRDRGLLGTVAGLAIFGVALGTAALVVAMGLMSGYRNDLAEKLAGTNAEVLAIPGALEAEDEVRPLLSRLPGVVAVARTAFAPGLLLSRSVPEGADVLVKGLEVPSGLKTTRLLARAGEAGRRLVPPAAGESVPVLLGSGLAARLGVEEGATVVLETATADLSKGIAPPRRTALLVTGVVETGFSEVDDTWAVVPLGSFPSLAPPDARQGLWEMKVTRPSESDATVDAARAALGPSATVLDWKALNRDLFEALAIQQVLLFVVLALVVAVAAGTIVSTLTVLLAAKTRQVGVLSALGAVPSLLGRTFRLAGLLVGGAGILLGTAFGLLVCLVLTRFRLVRFPPEIARVYYLDWMPFRPEPLHVAAIVGAGLLLVLLSTLRPARRAGRLDVSEALRYE
ncbi:MAG: ABC transporter permease [Acidobacteria bacterium]|nr:MAG: ABC transporter permease [Acidobacteriota bacterium]